MTAAIFLISVLFTLASLFILSGKNYKILLILCIWCLAQLFAAGRGFYLETNSLPPRFLLIVIPPVLAALFLSINSKSRQFLLESPRWLIAIHIVRIPVEIVLFRLYLEKSVPELMTFSGRNFDILSGISALGILFLMIRGKSFPSIAFKIWNAICLMLLFNIVVNAVLSVPSPFQQQAFDQPNVAVLQAPYVLLPGLIVPAVLLSHLVLFRWSGKSSHSSV